MTFHVRLVSVPDRTTELVEALAADVGVSNLIVLSGAARGPARRERSVAPRARSGSVPGTRPSSERARRISSPGAGKAATNSG